MKRVLAASIVLFFSFFPTYGKMGIGANVNGPSPAGADYPFVDLIWQYGQWNWASMTDPGNCPSALGLTDYWPWPCEAIKNDVLAGVNNTCPKDEHGYPLEVPYTYSGKSYRPVMTLNWQIPLVCYPYGKYTFICEGKGTVVFGWDFKDTIECTGGKTVFQFTINQGDLKDIYTLQTVKATTFKRFPRSHSIILTILKSQKGDHIRNMHLIRPDNEGGDSWSKTYETCPFNPLFIKDHMIFKVLRFMDWNNTNANSIKDWKDRITPLDHPGKATMKWEDGLGESAQGAWTSTFSVPYEFQIQLCNIIGADYWLNVPPFATDDYVRQLATLVKTSLNANSKLYLEWANETWNPIFIIRFAGTDPNTHIRNAVRIGKIFDEVFGADKDRIINVIGGQFQNPGVGDKLIEAYKSSSINPTNFKIDAYSIAAYFTIAGASALQTYIDAASSLAKNNGMIFITNEAGLDKTPSAPNSTLYDCYTKSLAAFDGKCEMFTQFVAVSPWAVWGHWGAKEYVNQPLDSAGKYKALYEWAVNNGQFDPKKAVPSCNGSSFVSPRPHTPSAQNATPLRYPSAEVRTCDLTGRLCKLSANAKNGVYLTTSKGTATRIRKAVVR